MNRTSWIIIGVAGVICLAIGILVLWPGFSGDWQTYKETKLAKNELEELSQKKSVLGELAKNPELDKISQTAAGYIPEEAKSSELILELTAIVAQAKMSVDEISLEAAKTQPAQNEEAAGDTKTTSSTGNQKPKTADSTVFTLTISGGFTNLMEFFKLIETSSRLISIQNLKLSQKNDKFTADIEGEAYWKKIDSSQSKSLANISVSSETLKKFANLRTYSTPIDTSTEAGFGRTNPFEDAK